MVTWCGRQPCRCPFAVGGTQRDRWSYRRFVPVNGLWQQPFRMLEATVCMLVLDGCRHACVTGCRSGWSAPPSRTATTTQTSARPSWLGSSCRCAGSLCYGCIPLVTCHAIFWFCWPLTRIQNLRSCFLGPMELNPVFNGCENGVDGNGARVDHERMASFLGSVLQENDF